LTIDKEIAVLVRNVYRSWNEGINASTRTRKLWVTEMVVVVNRSD
jgi:hypothetical protein